MELKSTTTMGATKRKHPPSYSSNSHLTLTRKTNSNWRMLLDYGFLRADNPLNRERVLVNFSKRKVRAWGDRNYAWLFWQIRPFGIMRLFRLVAASSTIDMRQWKWVRNWETEQRAAKTCSSFINNHLAQLPTTLAMDYPLLHTSMGRKKLALVYRIERKKLLLRTANFCTYVSDSILPCLSRHALHKPRYHSRIFSKARSWGEFEV